MLIELDKRVGVLESQIGDIRVDLARLTTRSEQFATKVDIQDLRVEMHQALSGLYKEVAAQTKWLAATLIGVAAMCMTAAKLLF